MFHTISAEISLWAVAYSCWLLLACSFISTIPLSHAFVIHVPHYYASRSTTTTTSSSSWQQHQQRPQRQSNTRTLHSRVLWQSIPSNSDSASLTNGITISKKSTERQQQQLQAAVQELKNVLYEEYTSMFNPMRREFYAPNVTFDDPLTQLQGVDAYQRNVDLLGSRTFLGAILFENSNIVLHSVKGGDVVMVTADTSSSTTSPSSSPQQQHGGGGSSTSSSVQVTDITTRWTLSMTFCALPWKPTARFTGVSIYNVEPYYHHDAEHQTASSWRVRVLRQQDYWDSINLIQGGTYQKVDTQQGVQDLLRQFFTIPQLSEPEQSQRLPYQLLRRAKTYQVRRYPSFTALQVDNTGDNISPALQSLAADGVRKALRPVIINFNTDSSSSNTTSWWWLPFSQNEGTVLNTPPSPQTKSSDDDDGTKWVITVPSQVIAVAECTSLDKVQEVEKILRENLDHDGIQIGPKSSVQVQWAIFDNLLDPAAAAVINSGSNNTVNNQQTTTANRKVQHGEVWITLPDGCHPWSD